MTRKKQKVTLEKAVVRVLVRDIKTHELHVVFLDIDMAGELLNQLGSGAMGDGLDELFDTLDIALGRWRL